MSDSQESTGFDASALLEKILSTGKRYADKGQALAEEKLDIPEHGEEREVMLDGLKKGALASALLMGLFGTKGGRKLTGAAIKIGGLAALGTVAYKGYRNWQETGNVTTPASTPLHQLASDTSEDRGLLLIQAMVAAANADGNIDSQEQQAIKHEILEMHLPGEMAMILENIIDSPLSADELANLVSDKTEASEVYIATRLLIGDNASDVETRYKNSLVSALDLSVDLVSALEAEIS